MNNDIEEDFMPYFKMKIRDLYIKPLKEGLKKHEFRLNTTEREKVKIGDYLILEGKQEKKNYVKVIVTNIKKYISWNDIADEYWEKEFCYFFDTKEIFLKEVSKYYQGKEIEEYGIICYEIEKYDTPPIKGSSILMDTNIIIDRESISVVPPFEVQHLFKRIDDLKCIKMVSKESYKELEKYSKKEIKSNILAKLASYNVIEENNTTDDLYKTIIDSFIDKENGKVDNNLLLQVYNDSCSYLLTNDKYMLSKAEKLYIRDRVQTPLELLDRIEKDYPELTDYNILNIKKKAFSSINLSDDFFDSLKSSYKEFSKWFRSKANDNEFAYVFESDDRILGFLYVKTEGFEEDYSKIEPTFQKKKRLKVGTFKINYPGFRIGERFLNIVFDNARKQDVDEIYITMFQNSDEVIQLRNMLEQWGFKYWGTKNSEIVLVKDMRQYDYTKNPKYNFPLLKEKYNVFYLPIEPQYHTDLFPDMFLKNENIKLYEENKAHRFALEKVYVSGNYFTKVKPGDIVLIYRKGDRWPKKYTSTITGIAIIESSDTPTNIEDYLKLCSNRSLFSRKELYKMYRTRKRVLFLLNYKSFRKNVTLGQLQDNGMINHNEGPKPLLKISKNDYVKILEMAGE